MKPAHFRAASFFAALLYLPVGLADPWHQYADRDAYWHHGSGWVWPRQVIGFELVLSPYQIDGNDDVGSEYVMERGGIRRVAFVDVYYPDSAASGARLETARAALAADAPACARLSEEPTPFAIEEHPEVTGVRLITTAARSDNDCAIQALYFFRTANWAITVRTSTSASDAVDGVKVFDAFVRALEWHSLGTDSHIHGVAENALP